MMKAYRFYFITIGLIILIFGVMTMTVNATEDERLQHQNAYYEEMEDTYVEKLKCALTDNGYRNAGITMTKVFYENGKREYTVKLHHKRLERLDETMQQELLAELSEIEFADSEVNIYLKFL